MRVAFRCWVGLVLVISGSVARADDVTRRSSTTPPGPFEVAHTPSIEPPPAPRVTLEGRPVVPSAAPDPSTPQASAGSPAKRRAVVSPAPSVIDRYLAEAVRVAPGRFHPLMALKIGASSQEIGVAWMAPPELAQLAPDAARHHDTVMPPHNLESGLLVGSLVLGSTLAFAPLFGAFLPVAYLRAGVVVAAMLGASVAVQAQYRPERLEALGRLIDASNAQVLASIEAAHGPLADSDRDLIDVHVRSAVHFLAPPGGQPRLWRDGKVLDPGPGYAFLPSILADVPAASLMAEAMVRLQRLGAVLSWVGIGVELLGTLAALASIPLGAAVGLPLLLAGSVAAIAGATGSLLGVLKAAEAQELLPKVLDSHAQGLATRIGGRLP